MEHPMAAWILSLMLFLQPARGIPWAGTYEATATAIAEVVQQERPLFDGEHGREKTAALLVSLAFFESNFRPDAVGDHGAAKSLYQVHGDMPVDARAATREALAMIRQSFRACASKPLEERLGWYASGGPTCDVEAGLRASRHRVGLAMRLVKKHPPP